MHSYYAFIETNELVEEMLVVFSKSIVVYISIL